MSVLGLVVEGDGERERARLRVVEVVDAAGAESRGNRPAQVRLRVVAGVAGPGVQVAARPPQVDAREAERALNPRRVQRVRQRYLPQLHEPGLLDAGLIDPEERAADHIAIPILADGRRDPGPRPHHGAVIPAALAEDLRVAGASGFRARRADGPLLGVLVSAVAPQRPLGAVPDLPAVPDVEQAGDLQLAVAERRADAAGPVVIRVLHQARIGVLQREAVRVDVQRAPWVPLTHGAEAGGAASRDVDDVRGAAGHAAPHEAAPQIHTDRLADHRDLIV